jgi:serine/threonine protein kinase
MGEVYRAHDRRLDREVAIKVLPESLTSDPDRMRRFEQEARATAALNHPNILAVFEMDTHGSVSYLVEELLEGETLRERLRRGRIPLRKAIEYGVQIANGLAAAHEKGIVHRDLKPENLFIIKDGRVKILDFGLAKLGAPKDSSGQEPTVTQPTEPGTVMGTAAYMSPEQVRGGSADPRSDIFAFGTILYEMVTDKPTFRKPTSAETMTAILNEDPPSISQTTPNTPPALQRVVHRCLEKSPEQRFHSAHDLAFALEALSDSGTSSGIARPPEAVASVWNWRWLAGVVAVIVVLAGILVWLTTPARPPRVLGTRQLTHDGMKKFKLATDGARLYIGEAGSTNRIVQVSVNGGDTSPIPTPFANAVLLNISPDHTRLLILSHVATEAHAPLWNLPLPSGAPRHLADLASSPNSGGATWSPDGQRLLFTSGPDIYEANADGANPHKLVTSQGNQFCPAFSPDGKRIRFSVRQHGVDSLWEMRVDGSNVREVLRPGQGPANSSCGFWSTDGRYYFFWAPGQGGGNVWVMRDGGGLFGWRRSSPIQLTTGLLAVNASAVSLDDKKLFVGAQQGRAELVRYDPKAQQFVSFLSGISAGELDYSRDGQWVTYILYPDQTLWRSRSDGSDRRQLTFAPVSAGLPRFSPDGTQIAYIAHQKGQKWKVYLVPRDGGTPQDVADTPYDQADPSWSSDGKKLAFGRFAEIETGGINLVDLATRQVSDIPGSQKLFSGRWSPDGQYMAALTTDSTKLALFNFKTQTWSDWVTEPGAFGFPNWSADSQYLYYDITFTENETFRRVKVGQNHSELLADLKGLLRYSTPPAFQWSGVAPDGSALFVRDLSTDEVYALDLELPE